jgi:GNAT superfamily N-acetyltransferase
MTGPGETLRSSPELEVLSTLDDNDLTRLTQILAPAFNSIRAGDIAEFIPAAISADSADVLVSRNNRGNIASVMLVNIDYGAGKLRGRIDDVATHKDSLRQGHAGAILDFALEWFRLRGVKRVNLTSRDGRDPAHELYRSRGFTIHDTNQFQIDLF